MFCFKLANQNGHSSLMGILHVAIAKSKTMDVICGCDLCFILEDGFTLFCAILHTVRILAFSLCYFKPVSPQIKCPDLFCEFF